jgi:serpin B
MVGWLSSNRGWLKAMAPTILAAVANYSCSSARTADTGQAVQSNVARVTAPAVTADDATTLAADNLSFAVDLYQALRTNDGNLVFSPASISIALAMAYAGSATTTAAEIASVMQFTLPADRLHPAFDALDLALTTQPSGAPENAFALTIANAAWGQQGFSFLSTYLDLLAEYYGAGLRTADFMKAPEPSRVAINAWVSEETSQQIPQLLPAGSIDGSTRLVLTDAVYFHGDWQTPFDPGSPAGTFHAPSGDVSVPMMTKETTYPVWTGMGWTAVALPYVGGTTFMILVVPDAGTFTDFEAALTATGLTTILAAQGGGGALVMPRFKFSTAESLAGTLGAMGMPDAFNSGTADFSGIDGQRDLYISDVVHQADIAVDEKGTTAAAATGVVFKNASAISPTVVVDRPFLFFIVHQPTGALLFAGRVTDPSQ